MNSLLTSLVADSLTGTRHNPNRELVGQGLGNIIAGLLGGLPGPGSTTGTVTNIRAGGSTPVSGALYGLFMLALVLGLGRYVEPIPLAVLAGILMKVGLDIIDWRLHRRAHLIRRDHLLVMLITLGLTVFVDLVTAVAIGLIAAGMSHARRLEGLELDSAAMVIEQLVDAAFDERTEIIVMGLAGTVADTLQTLRILWRVPRDRIVDTMDEAQDIAAGLLAS